MLFNSLSYLIYFPIVALIYFILPHKVRYIWLLITSYFFYMCWNAYYAILMFGCTLITYLNGIFVDIALKENGQNIPKEQRRTGRATTYVITTAVTMLLVLAWFKYANFVLDSVQAVMNIFHVSLNLPKLDIVLPVGISFFTFQALGYAIDVYRGDVKAEKNFFKYAVFVSFFPQLVAGPIERSAHLLKQFDEVHKFDRVRITKGILMMLWGYFQKVVIADRIAVIVNQVFNYYTSYRGFTIMVGAVLFAVQVYCDFAGYTNIAIGSAQVMGFELMQNFKQPYLAKSVADFWRRWHISLTSWFRDYIYFPLGGSRCATWKRYRNIMIVFFVSGLWHGAMWTYVIWGVLNGLFQVIGSITLKTRKKVRLFLHISDQTFGYKLAQVMMTFILVDITWIFFRANSVSDAFAIFRNLFSEFNPWILFDGTLYQLGVGAADFWITVLAIGVLFAVDIMHYRGIHLRDTILHQPLILRWTVYYAAIIAILMFGSYGPAYDAASFIYFQF